MSALDDRFEYIRNALARFRADQQRIGSVKPHCAFDHLFGALDIRAGQINLVDHRNNFEPVIDREIRIGQRLRFDALRRIHHQQRAFACRQRPRNLIREIHVPRRIDQVELVSLSVVRHVHHTDRMGLNGDAAFPLQVHGVEHLRLHLSRRE